MWEAPIHFGLITLNMDLIRDNMGPLYFCLFVCGISLTSGQLCNELFPDWTPLLFVCGGSLTSGQLFRALSRLLQGHTFRNLFYATGVLTICKR